MGVACGRAEDPGKGGMPGHGASCLNVRPCPPGNSSCKRQRGAHHRHEGWRCERWTTIVQRGTSICVQSSFNTVFILWYCFRPQGRTHGSAANVRGVGWVIVPGPLGLAGIVHRLLKRGRSRWDEGRIGVGGAYLWQPPRARWNPPYEVLCRLSHPLKRVSAGPCRPIVAQEPPLLGQRKPRPRVPNSVRSAGS